MSAPVNEEGRTFGHGLCPTGKYRYDTRHAADRGARHWRRAARKQREVYRCEQCDGFHLGQSFSRGKLAYR